MKKLTIILLSIVINQGCSTNIWPWQSADNSNNIEPHTVKIIQQTNQTEAELLADKHFQQLKSAPSQYLTQKEQHRYKPTINHYVRSIMQDLVQNLHYANQKTAIGVSSFIFLDGAYNRSSILGNQIAESFIHEIHQFGFPVIDFKTTDYIRVTKKGDFVFSRDFLELKHSQPIEYVLAGTLVKHQQGYLVNARMIGLESKAVVATAQGFIPIDIAESLQPSHTNDGITLIQGE